MAAIDTSGWGRVRLGDIVAPAEIYKAKAHSKVDLPWEARPRPGLVPFVTRTEEGNGTDCYVPREAVSVERGNALVVGDTTATVSYQPDDFSTGDHIVVMRPAWLDADTGLFMATMLRRERYRYSYGRAFVMAHIRDTDVLMPVLRDGGPDWEAVRGLMRSLRWRPLGTGNSRSEAPALECSRWAPFKVGELFDIDTGPSLEFCDCDETTQEDPDGLAFVARSAQNNGVTGYVKPVKGIDPLPAGAITVACSGSSALSSFVQIRHFYSGYHLFSLLPKEPMSLRARLFVTSLLEQEKYRYGFGRQANRTLRDIELRLPVSDDGRPDWEWADQFIKALPYGDRLPCLDPWIAVSDKKG